MSDASATIARFSEECEGLEALIAPLTDSEFATPTPAIGWDIAHQVAHLCWTDEVALLAATDPAGFDAVLQRAAANPLGFIDEETAELAAVEPAVLVGRWRTARHALVQALEVVEPGVKLPWFGPAMSARSMATASLMETWAHTQDVADALGVAHPASNGLKDICHLGVRTRDFAYVINGLEPPAGEFAVRLTGPDGEVWAWGFDDASDRVEGPAEDFCLLVTQRREPEQLALRFEGEAKNWSTFAQVFAGLPKSEMRKRHEH